MLVVWAVGAAVTYIMLPVNWFMEMIGFLAVFTEAMLGEKKKSIIIFWGLILILLLIFKCRRTAISEKLQKQIHAWYELPNGYNVDDWWCLQDILFHCPFCSDPILAMRNASGIFNLIFKKVFIILQKVFSKFFRSL
jgi:hypothetical protein